MPHSRAVHPRKKKTPTTTWRTRVSRRDVRVPVVIAGFGKMGGALALGLRRAKWPLAIFPTTAESVRRAVNYGFTLADHDGLREAGLCILAVPDSAVLRVSQSLQGDLGPNTALLHCAGALDLMAFGPDTLQRTRGSFHPLCAISSLEDSLAGSSVALSATDPNLLPVLQQMAEDLELVPIEVPEDKRVAYHAGAVLSAGGLVSLAQAAVGALGEAGIDDQTALRALLPLMRSAIRGIEARGLSNAMTGPLPRGDLQVVSEHLAQLPPKLSDLYRLLSLQGLELVGQKIPPETRLALEKILK